MEPAADSSKRLVIALRCGRLANRLVLFANVIALAESLKCLASNVTFHSYAHLFESTRRNVFCRYPVPATRSWIDAVPGLAAGIRWTRLFPNSVRAACRLNEQLNGSSRQVITLREIRGRPVTLLDDPEILARLDPARTVFVYGWRFRAPTCVEAHADKIRAYFRPIDPIESACRDSLESMRRDCDELIGVHIRQGDYRTWKQGRFFFPIAKYAAWMRELAEQLPGRRVAFFVCSDEPRSASEFPGLQVHFGGASPLQDLCTLAGCDAIVGPPSTFSQWASFYGNRPLLHLQDAEVHPERAGFRVSNLLEIP
ncbi:MAG: alpha-1,2-fucosyltransferase [Verrucomicrobiota bacterium]